MFEADLQASSGSRPISGVILIVSCILLAIWNIGLQVNQVQLDSDMAHVQDQQVSIFLQCSDSSPSIAQMKPHETAMKPHSAHAVHDTVEASPLTRTRAKRSVPTSTTSETLDSQNANEPTENKKKSKAKMFPAAHLTLAEAELGTTDGNNTSEFGTMTNEGFLVNERELRGWQMSNWTNPSTASYDPTTGRVTVHQEGTYILYGQIMFHNKHPMASFGIHVNDNIMPFVETKQYERFLDQQDGRHRRESPGITEKYTYMRRNTIAVYYLKKNDQVFLRTRHENMTIIVTPYLSFWGLAKLSHK